MPKWLGNRFGDAVPVNPGSPAPSAVYNMFDQYYMKQEGGFLKQTFDGSGGTKVTYNNVVYHTFTASGAFSVDTDAGLTNATISLFVQGAGGGGGMIGGGGGAGGQVQATGVSLPTSAGPFPVVIGTGGQCSTGSGVRGTDGGNTTFNTPTVNLVTATGGGGGGSHQSGSNSIGGNPGGCGGGGSDNSGDGPTESYGTSNQPTSTPLSGTFNFYGNRGGEGSPTYDTNPRGGGGGGGTGAAGGDFPNRNGGNGRPYTIPTRSDPTTQTTYWFGGGGGGSPYENNNQGSGGRGGGGGGWNDDPGGAALSPGGADGYGGDVNSNPTTPTPNEAGGRGATNSGGGGGGCRWGSHESGIVTGGPGILVISYPDSLG